jgi:hypothetical protein
MDNVNKDGVVIGQWIGTPEAFYPIEGLPYITQDNIPILFSFSEKQEENIKITKQDLPKYLKTDYDTKNEAVKNIGFTFTFGESELQPVFYGNHIDFYKTKLLAPISDVCGAQEFELHKVPDYNVYLCKFGMLTVGAIVHFDAICTETYEMFYKITELLRNEITQREFAKRESELQSEPETEQTTLTEADGEETKQEVLSALVKIESVGKAEVEKFKELIKRAIEAVFDMTNISTDSLRKTLKCSYKKAAKVSEALVNLGIISEYEMAKPRKLLKTREEWMKENDVRCSNCVNHKSKSNTCYFVFPEKCNEDDALTCEEFKRFKNVE